jgi:AraC-like DNA-binding protein
METKILHIKNMVCPRCISAVEKALEELSIEYSSVQLGEVILKELLTNDKREELSSHLDALGFELLGSRKSVLISRIKTLIIEQVHYKSEPLKERFSAFLSKKLFHDYGYLSHLFSSVEGITIEKFIMIQKIERVKELLFYNELTLSEIAHQLGYSSVSHLSSQFKKETGMTPTQFKKQNKPAHRPIDV